MHCSSKAGETSVCTSVYMIQLTIDVHCPELCAVQSFVPYSPVLSTFRYQPRSSLTCNACVKKITKVHKKLLIINNFSYFERKNASEMLVAPHISECFGLP